MSVIQPRDSVLVGLLFQASKWIRTLTWRYSCSVAINWEAVSDKWWQWNQVQLNGSPSYWGPWHNNLSVSRYIHINTITSKASINGSIFSTGLRERRFHKTSFFIYTLQLSGQFWNMLLLSGITLFTAHRLSSWNLSNKKDGYRQRNVRQFLCVCSIQLHSCHISINWVEFSSVSAISLRHIIRLPHESHAGMSLPGAGIWLRQESLRHILASPGYAPGIIAVNVTWMERGFNACQTYRSMYPSIFNRLRAIARYWSEIATFSYPLHLTPPLGVFPLDFREKFWSS